MYPLVVFIHVLGVVVVFSAAAILHAGMVRMRQASTMAQVRE